MEFDNRRLDDHRHGQFERRCRDARPNGSGSGPTRDVGAGYRDRHERWASSAHNSRRSGHPSDER